MELKVWVEGIQRVICGVTEVTTCQDVVLALAHATGKTGRFTLIERWRDNERFLAPAENPLKVLQKWGEYATDVQFILRQSDKTRTSVRYSDKFTNNFTPHQPTRSSLKKSLTFSGAHNSVGPPNIHQQRAIGRRHDQSIDSINENDSNVSQHGSYSASSPFQSLERRKPAPAIVTASNGSLARRVIGQSRDRLTTGGGENGPNSLAPRAGSFSSTQHTPREQRRDHIFPGRYDTRPKQPSPLTYEQVPSPSPSKYNGTKVEVYDLDSYWKNSNGQISGDQHDTKKPSSFTPTRNHVNTHNGRQSNRELKSSHQESFDDRATSKRQELINLITKQQQELEEQESKIKKSDSESAFLEEQTKDLMKQEKALEEEIRRIEETEIEINEELEELDIVSWVDKLEIEKYNEQKLQNEIKSLHTNIASFEAEIKKNKVKTQNLTTEMDKEKQEQIIWKKKKEGDETKTKQELVRLKNVLEEKIKEIKDKETNLGQLEEDGKKLDNDLDKKSEILAELETELKEFNMEQFQDQNLPSALEDTLQVSHQRSLSSSRAGSARQLTFNLQRLKETVSNSKDKDVNWV